MARKAGDGRGRLGGRKAGTPNKDKPLKTFLREHSIDYFTPNQQEVDDKGNLTGRLISQYDIDVRALDPATRVDAEIKLLKFHTPQMQATTLDVTVDNANVTLVQRIQRLARGEQIDKPEE